MATAARPVFCKLQAQKPEVQKSEPAVLKLKPADSSSFSSSSSSSSAGDGVKIMLQPRVCTLRSYGSDRAGVVRMRRDDDQVSPFFASLSEYIENSKKSQDFEIISGRLAMLVFAATVAEEVLTGNSLFRKMDLQGIEEAAGVCLGVVVCATLFAWFSSARSQVGRIFTLSCNTFIDSLIDNLIDGLFYDGELTDWSDDQ